MKHIDITLTGYCRITLGLMLVIGLSACAGKDKQDKTPDRMTELLRQEILAIVTDTDRANEAAELADKLRRTFVEAEKQLEKDIATFRSLNANYDARENVFQGLFMNINTQARTRQARVLAIRTKMKTLLTADEWKQLKKARENALKENINLL